MGYIRSTIYEEVIQLAKIATIITNYFEDSEYLDPEEAFKHEDHDVKTIEFEAGNNITGKNGSKVTIDHGIDDVSPDDFDVLFIPGGFSPDILRADDRFVKFAKAFMDEKKPVLVICHGPQVLITAEVLKDRDITGYKSIKVDLKNAGANYHDEKVVVCQEQLVSSRTPDDLPAFIESSLELIK